MIGLIAPIVSPVLIPLALVYARRSRRELGFRSGRTIAALVLALIAVALLVLAGALYLLAVLIGHSNLR